MLPMRSFHVEDLLSEAETFSNYSLHLFLSKSLMGATDSLHHMTLQRMVIAQSLCVNLWFYLRLSFIS